MESFTVQCTSCQSRIRVRNPNMIGQIANCPKCGSMILIAAPQKITVESGNPTDSVAVTRESLPVPDPATLHASVAPDSSFRKVGEPADSASSPPLPPSLPDDDPLANDFAVDESLFENLSPSAWMPEPVAPAESDVAASINNVRNKRLEAAGKSKQIMLIVGIGSLSVLLALGILFVFLSWFAKPQKNLANNQPVVVDPGKPKADPGSSDPSSTLTPSANDTPLAEDTANQAQGNQAQGNQAQGNQAQGNQPLDNQVVANEAVSTPAETASDQPLPDQDAATGGPTGQPANGEPANGKTANSETANSESGSGEASKPSTGSAIAAFDGSTSPRKPGVPLGSSIAPNLDDVLGERSTPTPTGETGSAELPTGLQNFANLFAPAIEPVLPDASVPLDKAPEIPENAPKPAIADAPPADALPSIVEKRLDLQLSGLLIDKRPLSETLCSLALIADMPVMADLDSILAGGLPRNPQIDFRATSNTKLSEVFKAVEKETGISFVPWENKVLYARSSDQLLEQRIPADLPIDDLVNDPQQTDTLLQALKEVVPEIAEASVEGGQLHLNLSSENRMVWFQLARLLESWRLARGITNEQTAALVPAKNALPAWPVRAIEPYAQTKIKQTLTSKEPIVRSWQRFTLEAKVACWVDWYSLAAAKISPSEPAMVINSQRTLADLLQHYADVYKVVFAIEDGRNLWVTTPEAHRVQPRLYLLPLADKSVEAWTEELQELAPLNPVTGESMLKIVPSPDGQYLFVRACRPILCQPERL